MGEWSTDRLDPATRVPAARDQQEQLAWERRTAKARSRAEPGKQEKDEGEEEEGAEQEEAGDDAHSHKIDDMA